MSHKNPAVISDIINKWKKHIGYLSIVRGNRHTLLGMNINIKLSIIQVDTIEQLDECIKMFG